MKWAGYVARRKNGRLTKKTWNACQERIRKAEEDHLQVGQTISKGREPTASNLTQYRKEWKHLAYASVPQWTQLTG